MSHLAIRLGFWSALLSAATFVVFTVCFVAILITSPLYTWTNVQDYVSYVNHYGQFFQELARLMMLLFAPLFVVLLQSIHEYAAAERKLLSRIAIGFGVAFAALISINYFVQISAVRLAVNAGEIAGLEYFLQANPYSMLSAINMLGWTLFLGLASLFVAPIFGGGRLEHVIRIAFMFNGVFCLLAGVGYVFEIVILVFLTIDLGMGATVMAATVALGHPIPKDGPACRCISSADGDTCVTTAAILPVAAVRSQAYGATVASWYD